ncbi:MAG: hypothetical protein OP8BY_1707 [Candidatus Saccharicenans subterraneus]|uniref:Uncharacterized protein n=1 Tax=Candidatus Saccharicenans subterraneus TaxID=2508984 RepID=A0A3E2BP72_9BACT|nr:MAG: hypothetical protein OP8BY_1707 [Candidatus Saccharicenans subterraneum]
MAVGTRFGPQNIGRAGRVKLAEKGKKFRPSAATMFESIWLN